MEDDLAGIICQALPPESVSHRITCPFALIWGLTLKLTAKLESSPRLCCHG